MQPQKQDDRPLLDETLFVNAQMPKMNEPHWRAFRVYVMTLTSAETLDGPTATTENSEFLPDDRARSG
ncbi:hypothetical protein L484_022955 [Morus notabilis]|uniref:Uncharacterized protein n=1 Tax=Morus notabilis TaxID=981085 RepID=W9R3Z8_9ROSA|nr:hypothetical protein L484_022955 [Morus notabilis]